MDRVILHCDLNNFFASVECVLDPTLRGKPVAVCGDPRKRHGIVLAKSEQAKKFGIKTGDVIWEALQKCPDLVVIETHHADYSKYSRIVRDIYYRYTDKVESFGGDECWLDVTRSLKLLKKSGAEVADEIRSVVKREVGLSVSVGVSWNKTFAKIGSDYKKPDATTVISRENFREIVFPMPVSNLLYIGRKSKPIFDRLNIKTIGDLAAFDEEVLCAHIGVNARMLVKAARGEDESEVASYEEHRVVKSVGNGTTTARDLKTWRDAERVMYLLCEEVAYRMRKKGLKGYTVSLAIKNPELSWVGAQESVKEATNSSRTILQSAVRVFRKLWGGGGDDALAERRISPVRAIRVCVSNLTTDTRVQLSLFHEGGAEDKNDKLSALFDGIRRKYGTRSIQYATLLKSEFEIHFDVYDE